MALLGGVLATVYRVTLPGAVPDHAASSLWQTLAHTSDTGNSALAEAARWAFTQAQSVTMLGAACCALAGAAVAAAVLRPHAEF